MTGRGGVVVERSWRSWLVENEAEVLADLDAATAALRDRLRELARWRHNLATRADKRRSRKEEAQP